MADPYTATLAMLESTGGKRMYNDLGSGATGKYQFMPDTWADLIRRFPNAGLTPQGITDNSSGGQQDIALQLFNDSNNRVLKKALGRDPAQWETYAAHRFGAGGAQDLLDAADDIPANLIFPKTWIDQNPDIAGKTVGQIKTLFQGRFGETKPIEVQPRPPTMSVQDAPAAPPASASPQMPAGLLSDPSSSDKAEKDPGGWGLLGDGWGPAIVAGLLSLGDSLRGGNGMAGLQMLTGQQQAAEKRKEREDTRRYRDQMLAAQMMPELDRMRTRQAQMQAAGAYADRLDAAGHKDLAVAVRTNPSLMDEVLKQQAAQAFPKNEPYTLPPGSIRFGADGKPIAQAPAQQTQDLVVVMDPATGGFTYRKKSEAEGMTAPPPRGITVNLNQGQDGLTQRKALADSLGVPLADVNPYENTNLSPKGRNDLFIANQKAAEKRWADTAEQDAAARQSIADMQRFKELNAKVNTGGILGVGPVSAAAGMLDSDIAELRAITAKIAPTMRPPGSGATSDFDAKQFERATVGIDKPRQANENIANARIAAAQLSLERSAFERAFFEANGHLQGADRAWAQYLNSNPIFDPKGKDFALNQGRTNWREFFGQRAQPAAPAAELDYDPATGSFKPRGR